MTFPVSDYKAILRLGGPILVGQVCIIITSFADTMMVGHYTTQALASASFVNNLFVTAMSVCSGFTYGLTPLVGALFVQKRERDIGAMVKTSALLTSVFTLLVMGVMVALYFNIHRMGQPQELLPTIRPYYLLFLWGLLPVALYNVFAQWSYAINRTLMPTLILVVCNALNIAGNYALIYGHWGAPELGLTGAGISTLVVRAAGTAVLIAVFFLDGDFRGYCRGFIEGKVTRRLAGQIAKTSWPVAAQMLLESGSFALAAVMAGWCGAVSLAAFQVILVIGMLGFMVYYSFGTAVAVLVSNNAGRSDRESMRRVAMSGYHIQLVVATLASLAFIFLTRPIMALFTDDPLVYAAGLALVLPLVLYQYGDCTQINFANALRGTSRVMPMMWVSAISYILVGIPAMYLLGFTAGMGVYGIILSFSVSLFLAAALYLYFFLDTTRRERRAQG